MAQQRRSLRLRNIQWDEYSVGIKARNPSSVLNYKWNHKHDYIVESLLKRQAFLGNIIANPIGP